jgi:hypothetical protein
MTRPEVPRLLRELVEAHRTARREDLAEALSACGLHQKGGPIFGVAFVSIAAQDIGYELAEGGKPAIIAPYFDGGRLLDLVACGLQTRTCRTREGICTVLGADHIEDARETETAVTLFPDVIEWLRAGRRGAVIVDWRAAPFTLADLAGIACTDDLLAARVKKALQRPVTLPQLFVREAAHAA